MNEIATYPSLKNKVVLVTGGAQGIGESIVEQFIKQQSKVAFLDIDEKAAENLVNKIKLEYKQTPLFIKCDLKDIDQLKNSISLVREKLGSISVLVNNAANDERHDIDSVTPEFWDDRMNINLKHYFFAAQSVVKGMKKIKSGSIVNLSSVSWMLGEGDKVVYETAKSAVVGLTRSFAQEFGKYNIRTNSVIPGSIATERQIKHWLTPKYKKLILDSQALKRQLKPEDVSKLVLFLSSDQSSGCTKQSFVVDAGIA